MMNVGSTTPACQGSKKTSISWRPRKYHGALEGFGVRVGLAGSSSGASESSDQTMSSSMMPIAIRNSERTRCGQVCTLSSPGPVAFLIGTSMRLPAGATALSAGFVSGVAVANLTIFLGVQPLGVPARRPEEQDDDEEEEEGNGQHARARKDEGQDDEDERGDAARQFGWHRDLTAPAPRSRRAGCARSG